MASKRSNCDQNKLPIRDPRNRGAQSVLLPLMTVWRGSILEPSDKNEVSLMINRVVVLVCLLATSFTAQGQSSYQDGRHEHPPHGARYRPSLARSPPSDSGEGVIQERTAYCAL